MLVNHYGADLKRVGELKRTGGFAQPLEVRVRVRVRVWVWPGVRPGVVGRNRCAHAGCRERTGQVRAGGRLESAGAVTLFGKMDGSSGTPSPDISTSASRLCSSSSITPIDRVTWSSRSSKSATMGTAVTPMRDVSLQESCLQG